MNFDEWSDVFSILSKYEAKIGRQFPSMAFNKVSRKFKEAKVMTVYDDRVALDNEFLGASSSAVIIDIQKTGTSERYEQAKLELTKAKTLDEIPVSEVTGIGAAKSELLHLHGVKTIKDLIDLKPKVGEEIKGTGINFTNMMSTGLKLLSKTKGRRLSYEEAFKLWIKIYNKLKSLGIKSNYAGSLRRKKYSIGDLDLIIIVNDDNRSLIIEKCKSIYNELLVEGEKKLSGIIDDFQVDMRFIRYYEFGCHFLHATGSAEFNQQLRAYAKSLGYRLNEYCIYNYENDKEYYFQTEEEVFEFLGLKYVQPEKR